MSEFKNVNVVYFYVTDWEAARNWYRKVLQWPVVYTDESMGWEEYGFEGSTHLAINRWDRDTPPPRGSGTTATLTVEDCHETTQKLRAMGVKCEDVVEIPGIVTFGTFYDLEGNRIQIAS